MTKNRYQLWSHVLGESGSLRVPDFHGIDVAKIRVANSLTHSLNIPNIGKRSKQIALFYLKKWESSTKHKRGKEFIKRFESLSNDDIEIARESKGQVFDSCCNIIRMCHVLKNRIET